MPLKQNSYYHQRIKKNINYINPSIPSVGAQHYRHHSRKSSRLAIGNAIAQTSQRRDNLSLIAKRVQHLRTKILVESLGMVAQMLNLYILLTYKMSGSSPNSLSRVANLSALSLSPSARCVSASARCASPSARCVSPSALSFSASARCASASAHC